MRYTVSHSCPFRVAKTKNGEFKHKFLAEAEHCKRFIRYMKKVDKNSSNIYENGKVVEIITIKAYEKKLSDFTDEYPEYSF